MIETLKQLHSVLSVTEKKRAGFLALFLLVSAAFQVAGVGSIYPYLELLSDPRAAHTYPVLGDLLGFFGVGTERETLLLVSGLLLAVFLTSTVFLAASEWLKIRFMLLVRHGLSTRFLEYYLTKDYSFFLGRNSSELGTNVLSEANQISTNLVMPLVELVSQAMLVVGLVALLLYINPNITLVALAVVGGCYALAYLYVHRRAEQLGSRYKRANKARFKMANQALGNIKFTKLTGSEGYFADRYAEESHRYVLNLASYKIILKVPKFLIEGVVFGGLVAVVLVFLLAGRAVNSILPVAGIFAFAGYKLVPGFRGMLNGFASLRFNRELLDEIHADFTTSKLGESRPLDRNGTVAGARPLGLEQSIEVRGVTFSYPDAAAPVIRDVSLEISAGERVAFVGSTGAGKTTIVSLIMGLFSADSGEVLVDGKELTGERARRWQAGIGYVPQGIVLMDDTVTRNIAYGRSDDEIDHEKVKRAARAAEIHEYLTGLPDGYETIVGERGVRLSGGQRQRIGIARALYRDPQVLILDEATSEIDSVTARNIARTVRSLAEDNTLISIAHQIQTLCDSDTIFVIEDGRILAEGRYEDLLSRSRKFRALAGEMTPEDASAAETIEAR